MILRWLRRHQDDHRLAQADAEALIRDHGDEAYIEAPLARARRGAARRDNPCRTDPGALAAGRAHCGANDGQTSWPRHGDSDA